MVHSCCAMLGSDQRRKHNTPLLFCRIEGMSVMTASQMNRGAGYALPFLVSAADLELRHNASQAEPQR